MTTAALQRTEREGGPQPIDRDRQPNSELPTRAELHRLSRRARLLATRARERAATLAEVDELAELVMALTVDALRGGP